MSTYDVIVIGAGMAGLTAARDLRKCGLSVVLLEGRDRIGGRTYVDTALGTQLEMGGAYVHWTQPYVWTELQKHDLTVRAGAIASNLIHWFADGTVHQGTAEDYQSQVAQLMDRLFPDARRRFPRPHDVESFDQSNWDTETLESCIAALRLSPYEQDVIEGALSGIVHSYSQHGMAQLLHGVATYFGSYRAFFETAGGWSIEGGTGSLLKAIEREFDGETRLSSPVTSVDDSGDRVKVTTRAGATLHARAVVLAVPLNTIGNIDIKPGLPPAAQDMIQKRNPVLASKLWVQVRGEIEPFRAFAPAGKHPINTVRTERRLPSGDTLVMCICSDASAISAGDVAAVQAALRMFVPEIEVVAVASHDWATDEFAQGGWMLHRPGQFTGGLMQLQEAHGRVYFAGADLTVMGTGSIEGAMASGTSAARRIATSLKASC